MTASLRERDVFFLFGCVQVGTRFSLCSVVSSMHLLTAGAVSRGHLVGVACCWRVSTPGGARRERRARCDCEMDPLRSSVDGSLAIAALFNRIIGIDSHVALQAL